MLCHALTCRITLVTLRALLSEYLDFLHLSFATAPRNSRFHTHISTYDFIIFLHINQQGILSSDAALLMRYNIGDGGI